MSDLVGRDQELKLIASFLEQARAEGGTLLFTGAAGVGKTALLDAAEAAALATGVDVLRAAGSEFGTRLSFSGLAELLRPLSADLRSLSPLHRRALAATMATPANRRRIGWSSSRPRWRCSARRPGGVHCWSSSMTCSGWTGQVRAHSVSSPAA